MATSVYFNNYSPSVINENMLLEDLIVESIQIMGHDIKYLPREVYDQADDVLGESVNSKFTRAYSMEMYLNVEGYEGDGDFFSKFGLEIRDTSNFVVSRRSFEKYVPSTIASRPREGDLLFVPVLNKIFEIKFVEEELLFFSLGRNPYIYELRCEVFRFSNEDFETGNEEIDDLEHAASYTVTLSLGTGTGNYFQNEIVYQGANLQYSTASAEAKHWVPETRTIEVINVKGAFTANANVIGSQSNTVYRLGNFDELADLVDYDDSDNRVIQTEADEFIDLSEINPFGTIMLSNAYFYHQLTRKYVILFGNMFNNITVKRVNKNTGLEIERFKVPIVYAPKEKYYARLRADPDLNRPVQVILPRMSFELTNFSYDASRKQNSLLRSGVAANTATRGATQYMGAPYDLSFDLQIYARNVDDGTHIIEQILPYFNPDYTVTVETIPALGFKKDVPIILNTVSNLIEHEGNFDAVRYVSWTLNFTMKANYYGPVQTPKIIRKVLANIYNDESLKSGNIVRLNVNRPTTNGHFKLDDVVYQGNDYNTANAYGYVMEWKKDSNQLVLGGTQGQFNIYNTIRAVSTNAVSVIQSFDAAPYKLVEIKIEPDPLDAEPTDDFGYATTITEFNYDRYNPTVDSEERTADDNDLTVDME